MRNRQDQQHTQNESSLLGVGLRSPHYSHILTEKPQIGWFEAISENYMGFLDQNQGRPLEILKQVRQHYPIVLHGVSLSIGSSDKLNMEYLKKLKNLIEQIEPSWVSDHLCWTGVDGQNVHDLLPLPYTQEVIDLLTQKIDQLQNYLQRQFVFENVSAYLSFAHSEMTEWEFINEIVRRTGCGVLLDINNIYVSSQNQSFNPIDFIKAIPAQAIQQFHLAGHSDESGFLIDTHNAPVLDQVWELYEHTIQIKGAKPTLIEWDEQIPEFSTLLAEANKAVQIIKNRKRSHYEKYTTF